MASVTYLVESKTRLAEVIRAIEAEFPVKREPYRSLRKTVLDTFDWRLFAQAASLCAIGNGEHLSLTFESPRLRLNCGLANGELPAFGWDIPAGRVQKVVASAIDVRRLLVQVQIELKVQTICLLNADQKTVARLHVQQGTAANPDDNGSRTSLPLVVLLAPIRGYERSQRAAADILEQKFGLNPLMDPLLSIAMGAAGVEPGSYVAKKTLMLEPDTRADQATIAICRSLLETIRANEDGIRRDLDSEFLHDFRVAVRRTRSALRLLKGVLPAEARSHFRSEFKWLGDTTSAVRDLDVYLLKLPMYRADLPESMRQDLDPLNKYFHRHHRGEHRRLVARLKSKRYHTLLDDWEAFLGRQPSDDAPGPDAARPIVEVASERIWKAYRRVYKCGREVAPETSAETLHELRIDCKMLRYLLEFFRSLYPPQAVAKLVDALRQLQDNLGDFNDLQVQQTSLCRFAREMSDEGLASVESLLAIGRLVEHLSQRQTGERQRFAKCWSGFATRQTRQRFLSLFKNRPPAAQ
jgi:CHAD domain-containing protein